MAARDREVVSLRVIDIAPLPGRRDVDPGEAAKIAESIRKIGLQTPITVRPDPESSDYFLVAGAHRLEAVKQLGHERIDCVIVRWDEREARMWEISENLHRANLTEIERGDHLAEWSKLVSDKLSETSSAKGGRPGNAAATARELGLGERDVRRALRVATLSPEAKDAAREEGLDDNQAALLEVASAAPARQVDVVREIAERKRSGVEADVKQRAAKEVADILAEHVPADAWDGLKANLYAAGAANIANALTNITGQSIMDRRFA